MNTKRWTIGMIMSLFVIVALGYSGLRASYRLEAKTSPASSIGKSGEMKSPGGSTGSGQRPTQ